MDPVLIGIHGLKQSGKSTACSVIEEQCGALGLSVAGRGFADYAKWIWTRQFFPNCTREDAIKYVDKYKNSYANIAFPSLVGDGPVSVPFRRVLAQFATEGGRELIGNDVWVDLLLPLVMMANSNYAWRENFDHADVCVITDVRFANELDRIKYLNGISWKIQRDKAGAAVIAEADAEDRIVHASELGMPDDRFDLVISNNDSLEDYKQAVQDALKDIIEGRA